MKIVTVAVIVALADGGLPAPKPEADVAPEKNRVNVATVDDANIEKADVIYDSLRPRDNQEAQAGTYRRRGVSGHQGGERGGRDGREALVGKEAGRTVLLGCYH